MTSPTVKEKKDLVLLNEKIPFDRLQLIADDGKNLGVVSRQDALRLARAANMDLVIIAESGKEGVPVAKVMDFGKIMYEKKKQVHEAKKLHKEIQVKEIQIRPKIGEHDLRTKLNQGVDFLKSGKRVKITITFRGRAIALREQRGTELLDHIQKVFEEAGLGKNLMQDKDLKTPQMWTRVYYLKK